MKPPKQVRVKGYKEKAFVVIGIYGVTLASPRENIAMEEYQRLRRGEFNPSMVMGTITYSLPLSANPNKV